MGAIKDRYQELLDSEELKPDSDQLETINRLATLQSELENVPPRGSILWRAFSKKPESPRGLYMWGGVGRGKSMLMDLFYESLHISRKKRVHFHAFMLDIHERLNVERKQEKGDPILPVVQVLADEVRLLAFDEMVVNNTADAMILSRLFTGLIDAGVTVVATSNRPPIDLYKDGLNRQLFLPFIDLLQERLDVLPLNGPTDYRLERLGGVDMWHVPNGEAATKALSAAFFSLTDFPPEDAANVSGHDLEVQGGRIFSVPKSLKGVGVFSFKKLCAEARGAPDYLAIARYYHSVIIVGIPVLSAENRNEAARFVTLIDALYEYKVKLLASADAEAAALYPKGDGAFEFERTVSRLMEMQSDEYLALGHGQG